MAYIFKDFMGSYYQHLMMAVCGRNMLWYTIDYTITNTLIYIVLMYWLQKVINIFAVCIDGNYNIVLLINAKRNAKIQKKI
jgi:hypothetical protein